MTDLVFEWDERKNRANRKKHGVSFEEARSAFLDENARFCLTRSIPRKRIALSCLDSARRFEFSSYVIAIAKRSESYESFPLERQIERSSVSIVGGSDEEALRLFQVCSKPLPPQAEEAAHHSARRGYDRLLSCFGGEEGDSVSEPHQSVSSRLCRVGSKTEHEMGVTSKLRQVKCEDARA
jgi:uncharacterized DUF497 family protein